MINLKVFYNDIRISLFDGKLSSLQVEGIDAIIKEFISLKINNVDMLAYILATAKHETANTMQPIEEYGKGKNYPYGRKIKMSRKPYESPNKIFYGRGHVQLTWYENYLAMGKMLGIDLLNFPERALEMSVSVKILIQGMLKGMFTGRKLSDYFTSTKCDTYNARRIVNGIDKAITIQNHFNKFRKALALAE